MDFNKLKANENITAKKVVLIDSNGQNIGTFGLAHALDKANKLNLDLVQMNDKELPVCKILDFGKLKYESKKKQKDNKKSNKAPVLKEIKFRPNISENDFQIKLRQIISFITRGDKVKIIVFFRGREAAHIHLGEAILTKVANSLSTQATCSKHTNFEGGRITALLEPIK